MRTITGLLLTLLAGLSATGCSDAAVKLAYCVEAGAYKLASTDDYESSRDCDLGLQGHYVVVLYPAKDLTDSDLSRVGMSDPVKQTVRGLQFTGKLYESIYVIPQEKQEPPSRTTYQKHSVIIPELIAIDKYDDDVSVILRKTPDGIAVVEMK